MCGTCGCSPPGHSHEHDHAGHEHGGASATVDLNRSVLTFNDRLAEQNRGYFKARELTVVNLLSGPGSGKTTLIEKTIAALDAAHPMGVIVGDLQTENDAERLRAAGGRAVQITTGEVCHLDAHMVQHALEQLDLGGLRLLLIENVGNLVCPASFDLGESRRVVMLSTTEGEDKPLKYPVMFQRADLVLISKMDLAGPVEFDLPLARQHLASTAPGVDVIELSARTGEGMEAWLAWLTSCIRQPAKPHVHA